MLRNVRVSWLFPPVISIKLKFNCLLDYFLFCNINIFPNLLWHIEFFNILINKVFIKFGVLHRLEGPWSKVGIRARSSVGTVLKVFVEINVRIEKPFESLKYYQCWFVLLSFNKYNIGIGVRKGAILAYLIKIGIEMVVYIRLLEWIYWLDLRVRAPICWFYAFEIYRFLILKFWKWKLLRINVMITGTSGIVFVIGLFWIRFRYKRSEFDRTRGKSV